MKRKANGKFAPAKAAAGLLLALAACLMPLAAKCEALPDLIREITVFAAELELPSASLRALSSETPFEASQDEAITPESTTTVTTSTTTAATTTTTTIAANQKPVVETTYSGSGIRGTGANAGVYVKNSSGYDIDIDKILSKAPNCKIKLNAGYQVLIVHTHSTESYAESDSEYYDTNYSPRTTDGDKSVIAVGEIIAQRLEARGIRTLHITTVHDYPEYNGSYNRAAETIKSYLEKHPSIEMVLDVHRDSITREDGTKIKPTALIDGKKAAQLMILTGCDAGGKYDFPNWEQNLRMALRLQKKLCADYPELMRPVYFVPFRYNMNLTPNSLLLEFGTDVNTLEEASYTAVLLGDSLAELLVQFEV